MGLNHYLAGLPEWADEETAALAAEALGYDPQPAIDGGKEAAKAAQAARADHASAARFYWASAYVALTKKDFAPMRAMAEQAEKAEEAAGLDGVLLSAIFGGSTRPAEPRAVREGEKIDKKDAEAARAAVKGEIRAHAARVAERREAAREAARAAAPRRPSFEERQAAKAATAAETALLKAEEAAKEAARAAAQKEEERQIGLEFFEAEKAAILAGAIEVEKGVWLREDGAEIHVPEGVPSDMSLRCCAGSVKHLPAAGCKPHYNSLRQTALNCVAAHLPQIK